MLGVSRTLSSRLLKPAALPRKCSVRNKTVKIFTISPVMPPTNKTMGPYPRTQEEREKAARKYNMIPEDYEPFPEDEGYGDYPNLPAIGAYNRDKYDDFEDIWECRHYGEPFHLHADAYSWERIDPMHNEKLVYIAYPYWKKYTVIFGSLGLLWAIGYGGIESGINFNWPWKIREYHDGPLYAFPESPRDNHHKHGH